jgi:hypothetical protein
VEPHCSRALCLPHHFTKAAGSDKELEHTVFFFAEMALMKYGLVSLCPSLAAPLLLCGVRCSVQAEEKPHLD